MAPLGLKLTIDELLRGHAGLPPKGPRKAATVTRWMSGSSPVRYLRNSVTLFSRAATWLCRSSSRRLASASSPVLLPLNLFRRLLGELTRG